MQNLFTKLLNILRRLRFGPPPHILWLRRYCAMKHIKYFVGNLYLFSGHFCLLDTASLVNPIVSKRCIAILSIFLVPESFPPARTEHWS